jgi:aldose 1-epimerase
MKPSVVTAGLLAALLSVGAFAATAERGTFGIMPDGRTVEAVTLKNKAGIAVRIIGYGASIQSVIVPGRNGTYADVALGYATLREYLDKPQYFGATVGRVANRIAKGEFVLDGKSYRIPANDGPNALHGGPKGFDKVLWSVASVASGPMASVTLRYVSVDGDQGFPGTLAVKAIYSLDEQNRLTITYEATTDKPTVVNLSNHAYWNLSGEGTGSVMDCLLTIPAEEISPVDATLIPTGEFLAVAGTPFDFRAAKPIGRDVRDGRSAQLIAGRGFDMNWVIGRKTAAAPRLVARVEDPQSGRVMELLSAQPGLQFYSGNFLDGTTIGKSGHIYRQGDAFVLEPQMFPDTPNRPAFGSLRLAPGEIYRNTMTYRFSVQ